MAIRPTGAPRYGVTLVELLVVLAITAILLAVGVPVVSGLVDRNRVAAEVDELIAALALARSEALTRRARVILCSSESPNAANATCSATATNWDSGWILFVDSPTGGTSFQRDPADANEAVIRANARTSAIAAVAVPALSGLSFTADGTVWLLDGAPLSTLGAGAEPLRFDFAGSDHANRRSVCVSTSGRARVSGSFGACT